jgi:hypothetical protein
MTDETLPPGEQLTELANGFRVSQCLYVAARLGIADRLAGRPRSAAELAAEIGAHAPSLDRILRALASVGVFAEPEDGRFSPTSLAERLRTDAPDSRRHEIINRLRPANWQAWGALLHSALTGESAFRHVHGVGSWEYLAQHLEESKTFDAGMGDISRALVAAVVDAYDFGAARCVVDVGGGRGELLAAILGVSPAAHGILFDQPHVVVDAAPVLRAAGVADRCAMVAGSFFERVPRGGDLYVLQHIIHNWDDAHAVRILRACRDATGQASKILLIEGLITPGDASRTVKLRDLMMLVAFDGARERTADEYAALLARAGFHVTRVVPTEADESVIEAVPV